MLKIWVSRIIALAAPYGFWGRETSYETVSKKPRWDMPRAYIELASAGLKKNAKIWNILKKKNSWDWWVAVNSEV